MINIVIGKPGSGKTYHMVRYLYDLLVDLLKKQDVERKVYTNISVNIEEFNRQLSEFFKQSIDVSSVLITLESEDLKYNPALLEPSDRVEKRVAGKSYFSVAASSKAFFWNRFPDNAMILIDEIQKYLSTVKEESESEKQSLIEYFSLHRHRRHDWFFITQNLLSLPVEIRRVAERVYNVFNAKSMSLGFPINVPMRDIETLLAGFNIQRQVYRVREGYLENTYRVNYDDSVEVVLMERRVFALYQTHTQLKGEQGAAIFKGDSALPFDLGPGQQLRAVGWFLRKHGFHLGVKLFLVIWFFTGVFMVLNKYSPKKRQNQVAVASQELPVTNAVIDTSEEPEIIEDPSQLLTQPLTQPVRASPSQIVFNRVLIADGKEYRVGEIYSDKRIIDISARDGVTYEPIELEYLRDFDFVVYVRDWLQNVGRSQNRVEEVSSGSN